MMWICNCKMHNEWICIVDSLRFVCLRLLSMLVVAARIHQCLAGVLFSHPEPAVATGVSPWSSVQCLWQRGLVLLVDSCGSLVSKSLPEGFRQPMLMLWGYSEGDEKYE